MIFVYIHKRLFGVFGLIILTIFCLVQGINSLWIHCLTPETVPEKEATDLIYEIIHLRNQALLQENLTDLASLYDRSTRNGVWAYEHQAKKMKYIENWFFKQGAKLSSIKFLINLRRVKHQNGKIRLTFSASTEYYYIYLGRPSQVNMMSIGTNHFLELIEKEEIWKIAREWYMDPLSDGLAMDHKQAIAVRNIISTQKPCDLSSIGPRRLNAVAYADQYCGVADVNHGYKYNPKYRNYNYSGGDCANFVSQVLHEGGGFSKTLTWNYQKDASRAWSNAHAFNQYMLNSGRASRIAYGTYDQVLKASYQLLPGDYIAYEKKGQVTHVSAVTGNDSKGYILTNSHNTDRYRVPWDLGFGGKRLRFYLVKVHY